MAFPAHDDLLAKALARIPRAEAERGKKPVVFVKRG
jgi:hypothetical protein